jgi:hypothetical protein
MVHLCLRNPYSIPTYVGTRTACPHLSSDPVNQIPNLDFRNLAYNDGRCCENLNACNAHHAIASVQARLLRQAAARPPQNRLSRLGGKYPTSYQKTPYFVSLESSDYACRSFWPRRPSDAITTDS